MLSVSSSFNLSNEKPPSLTPAQFATTLNKFGERLATLETPQPIVLKQTEASSTYISCEEIANRR